MAVTFQSVQISGDLTTGVSSSVVTKPTSLAVGDLMIGVYIFNEPNTGAGTPPSGFTLIGSKLGDTGSDALKSAVYYKIATSSDVAATNFTFTTSSSGVQTAAIMRIVGQSNDIATYKYAGDLKDDSQNPSISASITPDSNSLILQFWAGITSINSIGTYAIATSNPTWTEGYNVQYTAVPNSARVAFAYANRIQSTATGNMSCVGGIATTDWVGQMVSIPPSDNGIGYMGMDF